MSVATKLFKEKMALKLKVEELENDLEICATKCTDLEMTIHNTVSFLAYHTTAEEKAPLPAEEAMQQLYEKLTK